MRSCDVLQTILMPFERLTPQQVQLYAYLIERVCAEEWHKTIAHKTGVNNGHTLVPFVPSKLKRKVSADSGISGLSLSNANGTADGQIAIYWQIVQRLPVAGYFWDDEIFMKTFQSVDFDFLAFCNFYVSNSYKLASEVWEFADPITLDFRHAIQKNESQFSLSKKLKIAPVDPERAEKHEIFTKYWRRTFHDMMLANNARNKMIQVFLSYRSIYVLHLQMPALLTRTFITLIYRWVNQFQAKKFTGKLFEMRQPLTILTQSSRGVLTLLLQPLQ